MRAWCCAVLAALQVCGAGSGVPALLRHAQLVGQALGLCAGMLFDQTSWLACVLAQVLLAALAHVT